MEFVHNNISPSLSAVAQRRDSGRAHNPSRLPINGNRRTQTLTPSSHSRQLKRLKEIALDISALYTLYITMFLLWFKNAVSFTSAFRPDGFLSDVGLVQAACCSRWKDFFFVWFHSATISRF
ncbi:hypothetical protein Trydic_g11875 [Trypoxylus dichotomus]